MRLIQIAKELQGRAEFCCVYIKEAHPLDGWIIPENTSEGIEVNTPNTIAERAAVARSCMLRYNFPYYTVLDNMKDEVEDKYRSAPDRLYVIGTGGSVVWKSGLGPFFFDVESWYESLIKEI